MKDAEHSFFYALNCSNTPAGDFKLHQNQRPAVPAFAGVVASFRRRALWGAFCTAALLSACGGSDDTPAAPTGLACDAASIKGAFSSADTDVLLVQSFKRDDLLVLANSPLPSASLLKSAADVCLVKILVKGGNTSEPATEPSYSQGIGIEVYLPTAANWNERIRTYGSGGWAGGYHTDLTRLGQNAGQGDQKLNQAVGMGFVVSHSDAGHSGMQGGPGGTGVANLGGGEGEWAMKADGTYSAEPWKDYSERSMHVTAVKTKELVKAYYGKAHKYAYFDGFSTGGRQAWKLAQKYPGDYDGILAGAPAFNFAKFTFGQFFAQVAMQQDLGGPIAPAKLAAVNARAIAVCDTLDIGLLLNPQACNYDPANDTTVICTTSTLIDGVTPGANANPASCVTLAEAKTINKIWYGPTRDGHYTDPAADASNAKSLNVANQQMWYGFPRGTLLAGNFATLLAGNSINGNAAPLTIGAEFIALTLDDAALATPNFYNRTGSGADGWKRLTYAQYASAYDLSLQWNDLRFANVETDSADLSGLRDSGHKILHYHGLADSAIMAQGSINYYERAAATMGGTTELQKFARFYPIPGHAHTSSFNFSGQYDKNDPSRMLSANLVPMPQGSNDPGDQTKQGRDELFKALMNWVENGTAPGSIEVASLDSSVKMPLCLYPTRIAAKAGATDLKAATSYECR
jgi:feruloyl esterase